MTIFKILLAPIGAEFLTNLISEEKMMDLSARVSPRVFEMICIGMLGCGQLLMMTGSDSQSFILESVIHSIYERDPDRIDAHAGYFGQAICYLTFMFTCLLSPTLLYLTNAKTMLVSSSVCFTAFSLGFLYTNKYYYYFSSALNGVGFAFYYSGNGGYLTSHSSRKTIEANASISWAVGSSCMIFGSIIIALITWYTSGTKGALEELVLNVTTTTQQSLSKHPERQFSDNEIYLLFSVFAAISIGANITFVLIPSQDVDNCIESSRKTVSVKSGLACMYRAMRSPKMLILIPMFILTGVNTSLWLSVYPTTLTFNSHLSDLIYLPAVYSLGIGIGETAMGFIIAGLSSRIDDFGLRPTMIIGCGLTFLFSFLITMTTPFNASMMPTSDQPIIMQPSYPVVLIIAIIGGMGDCCLCSVRSVICAISMPNRRDQAFSVSKFYQSIGTCVMYFVSSNLQIYYFTLCITALCILTVVCFYYETRRIMRLEKAKLEYDKLPRKISIAPRKKSSFFIGEIY